MCQLYQALCNKDTGNALADIPFALLSTASRRFAVVCAARDCAIDSKSEAMYSLPRPLGMRAYKGAQLFFCQRHIDPAASLYSTYKSLEFEHDAGVYYRYGRMHELYNNTVKQHGKAQAIAKIKSALTAFKESLSSRAQFQSSIKAELYDQGHEYFFNTMTDKCNDMLSVLANEEEQEWVQVQSRQTKRRLALAEKRAVAAYMSRFRMK